MAVFVFRGQTQEIVTSKMVEGMKHYSTDPNSEYAGVTETWNAMQVIDAFALMLNKLL